MFPYPPSISVPFGIDAAGPYIRVVPVDSQIGVQNGAASWRTGFVPLNMTLKTSGGVAPFGQDMNGVMYYVSANVAYLMAGGTPIFNSAIVDEWDGYAEGSILRSASDPSKFFYSRIDDNANDPDSDTTGWITFFPLSNPADQLIDAPVTPITYDDFAVGKNVGFLDIDTTAGDVTITGITAGSDGQILVITNTGANLLTLTALDSGSASANQFRFSNNFSFILNDGMAVRYSSQIGKWTRM